MSQRHLAQYELLEHLEHGTIGETWKAFDTQLRRYVVVKIVEVNVETSSEFLPGFNYEGQAIAALRHPNIVHLQEFTIAPNGKEAYIVTDYVQGQSLADYLDATAHAGNIPPAAEIVQLLTPIAAALDYAHQSQVLHGALKPTAILLDKDRATLSLPGVPMITNFGMRQRQDPRLQSLDEVSYLAPEVAQGNSATSRSDLYSLGVILYELCTGTLPFQGETSSDVLMQHIHGIPTSPVLINPHIRPALTGVIMRSLAREPAARFSTATALVTAVAKAVNISMPESTSQSNPALSVINPPSSGDISDPNSPTYLSSPLSSQSASLPPTVASSSTPALPPPPVVPALPPTVMESVPKIQPPVNVTPVPPQVSGSYPVLSASGPMPVVTPAPPMSAQAALPLIPSSALASPASKRRVRGRSIALAVLLLGSVLLLVVLLGSGLLFYFAIPKAQQSTTVGEAFFVSSGLISTGSNQGVTDGLRISLENIPAPQSGKRYYGWLMSSSGIDIPTLALGPLSVNHGQIAVTYSDPQHNNLLANYSRFLVTEEDANQQPTNPSLDVSTTWRYYSAFSTVPNPTDPKHYSLDDHLRHLLSQDPKLGAVGLSGGLDVWLFRNTTKILEAAGSARDAQKGCVGSTDDGCANFILRQVTRILDYLDGAIYIRTENIPPAIQGDQLLIDPTIARVALLEFDPLRQEPPGYLEHIGSHLQNIQQISSATADQRALAIRINQNINNVQGWLNTVHMDASKLVHMSSTELLQPETLTLFNDLFSQANAAFAGQVDPNTNNVKAGVVQIHYAIQALATFNVTLCTVNSGQSSCA